MIRFGLLALGLLAPVATTPPPEASELLVAIDRPSSLDRVIGEVRVEAVVVGGVPRRVSLFVDGVMSGRLHEPPFHWTVEIDDPSSHHFVVVAEAEGDQSATASVVTRPFPIDDHVAVELRQLYLVVRRGGEPVLDLGPQDFEVLDDGQRQPLTSFARGDIPFAATVLVDASTSMAGDKIGAALAGAETFFAGMRPLDRGRLVVFSDRILHATPFTAFPEVLRAGLAGIRARGGTAANDHLYVALREISSRPGRRVVLLLSDGVDSHSVLEAEQVARAARRSRALLYWLRLPYRDHDSEERLPELSTAWRTSQDYHRQHELLRSTVEESGGRVVPLEGPADIAPAFAGILQDLRDQYALGYRPLAPRRDGRWREIRIRVHGPGLSIQGPRGYVDD